MKRIILLSSLIFFVSGSVFAQSKSVETFRNFWKLARSNKVKSAKKKYFANILSQYSENKDKQLLESFQVISQNKLKFPELDTSQVSLNYAFFNFQIESKDKKKFKGQALLLNQSGDWKVFIFDVSPVTETLTLPLLKPSPLTPVKNECSICG